MPTLADVDSVKAKFKMVDLPDEVLAGWNKSKATDACRKTKLKNYTRLDNARLLTAGAEALLLQAAEAKVKDLTWVLDGFATDKKSNR